MDRTSVLSFYRGFGEEVFVPPAPAVFVTEALGSATVSLIPWMGVLVLWSGALISHYRVGYRPRIRHNGFAAYPDAGGSR